MSNWAYYIECTIYQRHSLKRYSTVECNKVKYSTIQYSTIKYITIPGKDYSNSLELLASLKLMGPLPYLFGRSHTPRDTNRSSGHGEIW